MNKPEENGKASEQKRLTFLKAFQIAGEFGFIIALPLIGLGFLGKWMDARYHTKYFVLIGVLLAIGLSTAWLTKSIKDMLKDLKNR